MHTSHVRQVRTYSYTLRHLVPLPSGVACHDVKSKLPPTPPVIGHPGTASRHLNAKCLACKRARRHQSTPQRSRCHLAVCWASWARKSPSPAPALAHSGCALLQEGCALGTARRAGTGCPGSGTGLCSAAGVPRPHLRENISAELSAGGCAADGVADAQGEPREARGGDGANIRFGAVVGTCMQGAGGTVSFGIGGGACARAAIISLTVLTGCAGIPGTDMGGMAGAAAAPAAERPPTPSNPSR